MRILLPAFVFLVACRSPDSGLPVFGMVSEFQLTSHTGRQFRGQELNGKVWVANFIFTNCMGPCPRMTTQMKQVQEAFANEPGVRFVSITVDPARDTPEALAAYAQRHGADPNRWFFLTGPVTTLHRLKREVFQLGNVNGVTFEHSRRFVLVDGNGRIRGFYPTSEEGEIGKLIAAMRGLLKESA